MRSFIQTSTVALSILMLIVTAACSSGGTNSSASAQSAAPSAPPAVRHDERVFAGGRVPPGATMRNPYDGNAKAAAIGGQLFTAMHCDGCHGGGGTGWVGPSLSARRWRFGGSDAEVFQTIYYGRPHGMPAFGGLISTDGIWQIEAYLRSLPRPGDEPTESW